ncbi:hypothetical protein H4R33_005032, partial [Dimargaris cristalligena]
MYSSIICLALAIGTSTVIAAPTSASHLTGKPTEIIHQILERCDVADLSEFRSANLELNNIDMCYRYNYVVSVQNALRTGSVPIINLRSSLEGVLGNLSVLLESETHIHFYQRFIRGTLKQTGYSQMGEFEGKPHQRTKYPNAEATVAGFKDRLDQLRARGAYPQRPLSEFTPKGLVVSAPLQSAVMNKDLAILDRVLHYLTLPTSSIMLGLRLAQNLNEDDVKFAALASHGALITGADSLDLTRYDPVYSNYLMPFYDRFLKSFIHQLVNSLALGFVASGDTDDLKNFLEMVEKNMSGFYTPRHLAAAVAVELDQEVMAQGILEGHEIPMAQYLVGCTEKNMWSKAAKFFKLHFKVEKSSQSPTYDCKTYLPNDTTLHLSPDQKMALTYTLPNVS